MTRWSGPEAARAVVVLAPGDSGRLTDSAPTCIEAGLVAHGLRVGRFPFPDCDDADAARDAAVEARIRQAAAELGPEQALVLAGLSRGARISAMLADALGAVAVLAFAYPFHPRNDPDPGDRVARLAAVKTPVWLGQGTRDSHGNRQQVAGYDLANVRVHWLEDANHAPHPRARSGATQATQLSEATRACVDFLRERAGLV